MAKFLWLAVLPIRCEILMRLTPSGVPPIDSNLRLLSSSLRPILSPIFLTVWQQTRILMGPSSEIMGFQTIRPQNIPTVTVVRSPDGNFWIEPLSEWQREAFVGLQSFFIGWECAPVSTPFSTGMMVEWHWDRQSVRRLHRLGRGVGPEVDRPRRYLCHLSLGSSCRSYSALQVFVDLFFQSNVSLGGSHDRTTARRGIDSCRCCRNCLPE
jgi:hypothetical protein